MSDWGNAKSGLKPGWTAYVDWDRETSKYTKKANPWYPVYVQLLEDWKVNAAAVIAKLKERHVSIAVDISTRRRLSALAEDFVSTPLETESTPKRIDLEALSYMVVYIRGCTPETPTEIDGTQRWRTIRVGPAVPTARAAFLDGARVQATRRDADAIDAGTVLTGIIDDGIGVMHERFREGSGGTRVVALWRQAHEALGENGKAIDGNSNAIIGKVFEKTELDNQFQTFNGDEAALYRWIETEAVASRGNAAGLIPGQRLTMTHRATHGTFVADLAAGSEPDDSRYKGPIAAVEVPPLAAAETWAARLEFFLLQGLLWLIDRADALRGKDGAPVRVSLVITLSFGASAGPKDGTGFLEGEIRRHVVARNAGGAPTAIVIAAGNDFRARRRAVMTVERNATRAVDWCVQPADRTPGFLEIRVPVSDKGTLTVTDPLGRSREIVLCTGTAVYDLLETGKPVARLYVETETGAGGHPTGNLLVTLAIGPTQVDDAGDPTAPAGAWRIEITNSGSDALRASVEVQRDDTPVGYPLRARPSYLHDPETELAWDDETKDYTSPAEGSVVTREGTLSPHATITGAGVYVAGGAMGNGDGRPARYTGSGLTLRRGGPDLATVAEDGWATPGILGAGTFSGSAIAWGGTSAAVPLVARRIADHIAARKELPDVTDLLGQTGPAERDPRTGKGIMLRAKDGRPARMLPAP